jgi:hypothetical protein
MFIVAVTLGLLAVMGVYGLSATRADVQAAGHVRESLQAQKTGEHALNLTAEVLKPDKAGVVFTAMSKGQGQAQNCKTANPFTGSTGNRFPESCVRLDYRELAREAPLTKPPFTPQSFGAVQNALNTVGSEGVALGGALSNAVQVEITNPVPVMPVGNSKEQYATMTVTVYTQIAPAINTPAQSVVAGRGRLTVGPVPAAVQTF